MRKDFKKPSYWNEDGSKHYTSITRILGIKTHYLGTFDAIPKKVMEYLITFGNMVETALGLHLDKGIPFIKCMNDKKLNHGWKEFWLFLKDCKLTPIDYERVVLDKKRMLSGSIDLVCKKENGDEVLIEIKTRNLVKTHILESDRLQLLYYLDLTQTKEGFIVVIDRPTKDRPSIGMEADYIDLRPTGHCKEYTAEYTLRPKLSIAIAYYDNFIRDEVDKEFCDYKEIKQNETTR